MEAEKSIAPKLPLLIFTISYFFMEQKLISVILATDLSAAHDTIDTNILLNKMTHYCIGGEWSNLFRYFLSNRQQ